jgi:hypothetical protein
LGCLPDGERLVELRHPAPSLFQLRAQRLEGGAVVLLQPGESFQRLRAKGRARIGGGFLGQPSRWS